MKEKTNKKGITRRLLSIVLTLALVLATPITALAVPSDIDKCEFCGHFYVFHTESGCTNLDPSAGKCTCPIFIEHTCTGGGMRNTPEKVATCTSAGTKAYWICKCGKYYADSSATILIDDFTTWANSGAGHIDINAEAHDWNTNWSSDADEHWHACKYNATEHKIDASSHSWNSSTGKCDTCEYACLHTGQTGATCGKCGKALPKHPTTYTTIGDLIAGQDSDDSCFKIYTKEWKDMGDSTASHSDYVTWALGEVNWSTTDTITALSWIDNQQRYQVSAGGYSNRSVYVKDTHQPSTANPAVCGKCGRPIPSTHNHNWTYSLVGTATIKAICTGEGDCTVSGGKDTGVSLTLSASSANYSGSDEYSASLEGLEAFKTATGLTSNPTITYYSVTTAGATTGGTQVTNLTGLAIGNYYASVTVGGQTAVKAFRIIDPNAPTTFTVSFNANGGSGTMSDVTDVAAGAYTLPINTTFTAPAGKVFDGWSLTAGGTKISGTTTEVSGNITLYAVWKNKQGGGTGGGSGSGGSSYTPPTSTTTTPSNTGGGTIGGGTANSNTNITVNTTNGNAVIKDIPVNTIKDVANTPSTSGNNNTNLVIDVSSNKTSGKEVIKVTLTKTTAENIVEVLNSSTNNKENLVVKTDNANVTIDAKALESIASQAKSEDIQLVVENKQSSSLNESQKTAVESLNTTNAAQGQQRTVVQTFEAYIVSGGSRISNFGGGEVQISKVDYTFPAGTNPKNYFVYYIPLTGAPVLHPTWVEGGKLCFSTGHLSDYAIVYDETKENGQGKEVYRLWNPKNGDHLLTTNKAEKDACEKNGWRYEGVAFIASEEGKKVYRLYNPRSGEHFYTTSEAEKNACVAGGWRLEGTAFNSSGTKDVYRLYNDGMHLFTTSKTERDNLVKHGWKLEGVGFKAN